MIFVFPSASLGPYEIPSRTVMDYHPPSSCFHVIDNRSYGDAPQPLLSLKGEGVGGHPFSAYSDQTNPHVEDAVHLLLGHTPLLQQSEERWCRWEIDERRQPLRQDTREVALDAAAGDVRQPPHRAAIQERTNLFQ